MSTVACSDGLSGIWVILIWCRGAIKARFSGLDMMVDGQGVAVCDIGTGATAVSETVLSHPGGG